MSLSARNIMDYTNSNTIEIWYDVAKLISKPISLDLKL